MTSPISLGEHAPKTASGVAATAVRFVRDNLAAVIAAVAGAVLLVTVTPTIVSTALDFRASCGVAMDNTSLVLELDGWRAGAVCRQEVQHTKGTHQAWFYFGPSLCSRKWQGYTEYVHDYSSVPLLGALACASIPGMKAGNH